MEGGPQAPADTALLTKAQAATERRGWIGERCRSPRRFDLSEATETPERIRRGSAGRHEEERPGRGAIERPMGNNVLTRERYRCMRE